MVAVRYATGRQTVPFLRDFVLAVCNHQGLYLRGAIYFGLLFNFEPESKPLSERLHSDIHHALEGFFTQFHGTKGESRAKTSSHAAQFRL